MGKATKSNKYKNKKKSADYVFILVEGKTEEKYIKEYCKKSNIIAQVVIENKPKLSKNINKDIKEIEKELQRKHGFGKNDTLNLVYDIECSKEEFDKFIISKDGKYKIRENCYVSNRCFEVFLLQHFIKVESNKYFDSTEDVIKMLNNYLPLYKKGLSTDFSSLISKEDDLLKNTEVIIEIENCHTTFSNVHELLIKLKARK